MVFFIVTAGMMVGLSIGRALPRGHLSKESQEVIRLGTGMLSVLTSLLLGLLVASSKNAFDRTETDLRNFSGIVIQLGDTLRAAGSDATPALGLLHDYMRRTIDYHWEASKAPSEVEDRVAGAMLLRLRGAIITLPTATPAQQMTRSDAWDLFTALTRLRWQIIMHSHNTFQSALLWTLVIWITCLFASFGVQAPRNATVITSLVICAAAIGCAIFLTYEMESPFEGLIMVSGVPMEQALQHISR